MSLPVFFSEQIGSGQEMISLNEETSKHIITVLRMKPGMRLQLTDGNGNLVTTEILDGHKKKCVVKVMDIKRKEPADRRITIAISLTKSNSRFEWFLEKATEIGISEIIPLICERTEKQHIRYDRLNNILESAMLQSRQTWMPRLAEAIPFTALLQKAEIKPISQKFIAHCLEEARCSLTDAANPFSASQMICIGPEGDFTPSEINLALQNHFIPVTLGDTRLRTETAGVIAAALLRIS